MIPRVEAMSLRSIIALVVVFFLSGCAGGILGASSRSVTDEIAASTAEPMTQARMEALFAEEVDAILGPPGAIQTRVDGINVHLISDPRRDRMRIIAPIARVGRLDRRIYPILLQAGFHTTLDARYAISNGVVYAVFLHPISSLSPELLRSALAQVVSLVKTFGTSYSSGRLHFGR